MAASNRYRALRKSTDQLRAALLPRAFDPTGTYGNSTQVHLRTASFRVLAHAEIESFIEERASELFGLAWDLWHRHREPSLALTCLISFSGVPTSPPPETVGQADSKFYVDVAVPLQKVNDAWRRSLRSNNGIKEKNVLALFLPVGIAHDALDQTLLNDLSSFGQLRGDIAHNSATGVTTLFDPKTEFDRVSTLIAGLATLDETVEVQAGPLRRRLRRLSTTVR